MKRTTEKPNLGSVGRVKTTLGLVLLLTTVVCSIGVATAQPPLRQRRQGLAPGEEKTNNPRRDSVRRGNPGPLEPLTTEDRKYLRLVPQGVAFPRVLIRVFRELDLSADQQTKLENLVRRAGNQVPALQRLRRAQSELLDEALYGETFEPATIEQRASDLAATQAEIIKVQARLMTQIRQILKPEQGFKFRELLMRERDRPIDGQRQNLPQDPPANVPPDQLGRPERP